MRLTKWLKTQIEILNHRGESLKHRVNGVSFAGQGEFVVKPVEQGEAIALAPRRRCRP